MDPKLIIVQFGRILLFEDSSDDEQDILEKVDNYVELIVPSMTDKQFKMNFRITPEAFEDLLRKMEAVREADHYNHVGYPKTDLEKEALLTIWYLGNLESLRSVAERFGVSKSTAWHIFYRTCNLLLKVNQRFRIIHWPSQERQEIISAHFAANGFRGIIGAIDGSHIEIVAPKNYPNSYVNRKNYHSVLVQGVCDHQLLFTDIYAGEAGSIHDYTLYKRSDLYRGIINNEITCFNDSHLVGDLAYRLATTLMVGFKNNRNLTQREKNFNVILSKARVVIENAFALLKGRFRRLKLIETTRIDLIPLLIMSGCILHNVCILNGDNHNDIVNINEELEEERARNPRNLADIDAEADNRYARVKRLDIVYELPMILNQ